MRAARTVARTATVAVGAGALVATARPRLLWWGATPEEVHEALPGDDLMEEADLSATRAITIHAGAEHVWPWIAQIGQERGGFYSFDALENLAGCEIHSADRIEPAWQDVRVGDEVRLHPQMALTVADVHPGRALVLRGAASGAAPSPPYDFMWAFVLQGRPDGSTRLLIRERYGYNRRWAALVAEPVELASFVMTEKMLRGIRERAERSAVFAIATRWPAARAAREG